MTPVDSAGSKTRAKRPTVRIAMPGKPPLARPIIMAPRIARTHCQRVKSYMELLRGFVMKRCH